MRYAICMLYIYNYIYMYGPQTNKDKYFARSILLLYPLKMYDQHFFEGNPKSKFQHSRCKGTTNQIKAAQIRTPNSRSRTSRTCLGKPGAAQCDPPSLADIDVTYTGARWPRTTHIALSPPSISRRVWQNSHLCV